MYTIQDLVARLGEVETDRLLGQHDDICRKVWAALGGKDVFVSIGALMTVVVALARAWDVPDSHLIEMIRNSRTDPEIEHLANWIRTTKDGTGIS